jgi:hypothetical protein
MVCAAEGPIPNVAWRGRDVLHVFNTHVKVAVKYRGGTRSILARSIDIVCVCV